MQTVSLKRLVISLGFAVVVPIGAVVCQTVAVATESTAGNAGTEPLNGGAEVPADLQAILDSAMGLPPEFAASAAVGVTQALRREQPQLALDIARRAFDFAGMARHDSRYFVWDSNSAATHSVE